ncbi:MAG: hypothetical protein ACRDI0_10475 [Actinomycetota bacterium]
MEERRAGFNWGGLPMGSKGLLISGLLLFIALFLPWRTVKGCEEVVGLNIGCSENGFAGLGVLVAILLIGLLVWEGLLAAGVSVNLGTMSPALLSAGVGGAAALFAVIRFLTSLGGGPFNVFSISWGAFVGLVLAIALGYASYVRFRESRAAAPPPAPPAA